MFKKLLIALALCLPVIATGVSAQTASNTVPGYQTTNGCSGSITACWKPLNGSTAIAGTQTGVSLASATSLTVPAGANIAVITVEGTNNSAGVCARWRDDGTAPTASAGSPLAANAVMVYQVISSTLTYLPIQLIQASSATCTADVAYYK